MTLKFKNDFKKKMEKEGITVGTFDPPRYWFSTGNYVLNKTISGSFHRGIPQGRVVCYAGPSKSGKSFLVSNAMREAQKEGAFVVVCDSEHALDEEFVSKIGVNVDEDHYMYSEVDTFSETLKFISSFLKSYQTEYGEGNKDAPKVLIVIDSLDMMITDSELENFQKGISKGDQGQRSKQMKAMLRNLVHGIKHQNISILVTHQVYKNQDITNGEGVWIVNDAIKYQLSLIALLTKLKLRGAAPGEVTGIRMKCEGYATRFTAPFQTATLEIPYESGMNPYEGLLDAAVSMGIVEQKGAWYAIDDKKFYRKDFNEFAQDVLERCEENSKKFMHVKIDDSLEEDLDDDKTSKDSRKQKFLVES